MQPLTGKNAIVTGASRGIGRAIAERLAADGASVAVNFVRGRAAAEDVVRSIEQAGGKAVAVQGDVGAHADIVRLFDAAEQQLGALDIVVASAGVSVFKPHAQVSPEEYEQVFSVNTRGVFFILQEAARRVRDGGRVLHISSAATAMAYPAAGLYAGSKVAAERFVAALAKELGPRGITVNSISPGMTETDGLIMPKEAIAALVQQTPLGRLGQPADIAEVAAFLVSEQGRWMTGQNLRAAGGVV